MLIDVLIFICFTLMQFFEPLDCFVWCQFALWKWDSPANMMILKSIGLWNRDYVPRLTGDVTRISGSLAVIFLYMFILRYCVMSSPVGGDASFYMYAFWSCNIFGAFCVISYVNMKLHTTFCMLLASTPFCGKCKLLIAHRATRKVIVNWN